MKRIGKEEIKAVTEVLKRDPVSLSGYYKHPEGGPSNKAFEDALAEYFGVKHAITVSNGTAALHVALLSLGVGEGDEVIVPPITFSATATSVLMVGAKPIFADVDPKTYNLSADAVQEALTPKTKAVIPVHLLGTPCNVGKLLEVTSDRKIWIIEDNAQAPGAKYKGRLTGTFGDVSTLSFQETKSMTTGEGGAVLTNNDKIAEKSRLLRNHGVQYGNASFVCWNYRLTEMQAALGLVQLKKLNKFIKLQVENAKALFKIFPKEIHPPYIPDYAEPTFYIIGCLADEDFPREKFIEKLTEIKVNKILPGATVGLGYTHTLMDLPLFRKFKRPCPIAENLVKHFLWFDIHRFLTKEEFKPILSKVKGVFEELGF